MMNSENHIFEPDVVLASEFFTPRTGLPSPERALVVAVLEEAARCFLNYGSSTDRKQRVLYDEARDWFASDDRSYLYAFENVCDVLGIEPAWLRRRLFALRERRRQAASEAAHGADQPPSLTERAPEDGDDVRAAG
jgi:hypothetical protein